MFYSNEVYLVNSRYARVVKESSFDNIDVESVMLNSDFILFYDSVEGVNSRIFKILEVKSPIMSDNTYNENTLSVLIERVDGLRVICRVQDLFYTSEILHTFRYRNSRFEHYLNGVNIGLNPDYAILDKSDLLQSVYNAVHNVEDMKTLHLMLVTEVMVPFPKEASFILPIIPPFVLAI